MVCVRGYKHLAPKEPVAERHLGRTEPVAERHLRRTEPLAEVAVEEVDDYAVVGFALFAGRGRHAEATQRQIRARLDVIWNGKTPLYRRGRIL